MEEKHTEGNRGGFPAKEAAGADPEERRKSYQRFCETGQAAKKLEIALEAYLSMAGAGACTGREFADYERYLQFRRRPALEQLICRDDLEGLRLFAARGWISRREASGYLDLAVREEHRESQLWLLRYIRGLPEAGAAGKQKPEEAGNIRRSEGNAAEGNLAETMDVENSVKAADTGYPEETMDEGKSAEAATTGSPAEAQAVENQQRLRLQGASRKPRLWKNQQMLRLRGIRQKPWLWKTRRRLRLQESLRKRQMRDCRVRESQRKLRMRNF